jgi:hypothetical protein
MNRLGIVVFAALALGVLAMAGTDTSTSGSHQVWHTYAAKTPLTP